MQKDTYSLGGAVVDSACSLALILKYKLPSELDAVISGKSKFAALFACAVKNLSTSP